jgi:dienelactone hydrolase
MRKTRRHTVRLIVATGIAAVIAAGVGTPAPAGAQQRFELPDNVAHREVDIWSEGTRMAGDLYWPRGATGDLPAIVMSHGWGGTKAGLVRNAAIFAADGFMVLAFDYRGWGESDGKLVVIGDMPERGVNGEVHVFAREIRTIVDPVDQTLDIRRAFDFIEGEANVDTSRLGYWGSSYSGAHAIWVAANESRAACAVGQVAAADSLDLAQTSWRGTGVDIEAYAREQAIRRARGEIAPLPQGTDKAPNLNGWAHLDKVVGYRPVEDASRISIPLLVIDAENEELFDRHRAGELSVERAKANGARAEYRVIPDITHYDVYRQAFDESAQMARAWFNDCLKP